LVGRGSRLTAVPGILERLHIVRATSSSLLEKRIQFLWMTYGVVTSEVLGTGLGLTQSPPGVDTHIGYPM
jgi:hypothetical protein